MNLDDLSPVTFVVRPLTKGMNTSQPPQTIDPRESPKTLNCRVSKGTIQLRNGFKIKYRNSLESLLWIDVVYSLGYTVVVAFGEKGAYKELDEFMELFDLFDGVGGKETYPYFNFDPTMNFLSVDVGAGKYDFNSQSGAGDYANNGNVWPSSGEYDDIMVFCNGTSDGVWVIVYSGIGTLVEAQKLSAEPGAPSTGTAVVIFDNRVVVCGTEDSPSMVAWSSKGNFHLWQSIDGAGALVLGDSPDWIQTAKRLGDYLIVYKERSIYIGRRSMIVDPAIAFEPAPGQGIGLAAPNSVGDLGEEHIFLGWDDVYAFSLKGIHPIGTRIKQDLFYGENGIIPKYLGNCTGAIAEEFDEYWLFIPTGKWPEYDDGDPVENILADATFVEWTGDVPDNWTISTDGNGASSKQTGNLGKNSCQLAFGTGVYTKAGQLNIVLDPIPNVGDKYSVSFWLKLSSLSTTDSDVRVHVVETDSGDNPIEYHVFTVGISIGTDWTKITRSITIVEATCTKITLQVELRNTSKWLRIDAGQCIRLTDISSEYFTGLVGEETIGYIGVYDVPEEIPLIIDKVGQWIPDTVWAYNYEDDAWTCWRLPMTGFGYDSIQDIISIGSLEGTISEQTWRFDEKRIQEFAPTNLLAEPDGQVYEISKESLHDWGGVQPAVVRGYWESKDYDFDKPFMDKTFKRITLYHEATHGNTEITVAISTDSGVTTADEIVVNIQQGTVQTHVDFMVTGSQVRFIIRADAPGFFLTGVAINVVPRGESHAY